MIVLDNERDIIALAGLLHDIGKLLNRCIYYMNTRKLPNKKHQQLSVDFLELLEKVNILKHNDLLTLLVQRHHEDIKMEREFRVQEIQDDYQKALAYIVSRADNYSSSERREEEDLSSYFRARPLDSLFNELEIDKNTSKLKIQRYKLKSLSYQNIFPKAFDENTQDELNNLIHAFLNELAKVDREDFHNFFTTLYFLLEKYTWCLPSDTKKEICDISLFDHLRTTTAIAVSSYLYHKEKNDFCIRRTKDDHEKKFLLIGVKVEGISDYIHDLSTTKHAAKRLRGKSFLGSLICQNIADRMIQQLNLTIANHILHQGDLFYVLAPNTETTIDRLNKIQQEINQYFYHQFEGTFFLNLACIESSGYELKDFRDLLENVAYKLEKGKHQKFADLILDNPILGEGWEIDRVCPTCEKFFVMKNQKQCRFCQDEINIGTWLVKVKYIAFYKEDIPYEKKIKIFDKDPVFIAFIDQKKSLDEMKARPYIVLSLQDTELLPKYPSGYRFYANYVPTYESLQEYQQFGEGKSSSYEAEIKNFEAIADKAVGTKNLAILKIGMDHLQQLMDFGLFGQEDANQLSYEKENEKSIVDYTSISRIATLTRMLHTYFHNYIYNLFHHGQRERMQLINEKVEVHLSNHYVVSASGTDLIIIGPWNEIMYIAKFIHDRFKIFVSGNSDITLSAGIALIKNKEPIMYGMKKAEESFTKAQQHTNGLVLFDKFICWKDFDEVFDYSEYIFKNMQNGFYSQSFIYRLLIYTKMAEDYINSGYQDVEKLMYISRLNYDLHRNLVPKVAKLMGIEDYKREENLSKIMGHPLIARLTKHFDNQELGSIPDEIDFLYRYMRVCLNYAVRKNRGGESIEF